jgi:hypothetical protein
MPDEPNHDAGKEPEPAFDREAMERIVAEMAEMLQRMAEFQKEMEPFMPLLMEADKAPADVPDQGE